MSWIHTRYGKMHEALVVLVNVTRILLRSINKYLCAWCHQMETFSALLAFVRGIHRSPVKSPHKGQWCRALMFSLICALTNDWAYNRDASDLRCHRAHYDVTGLVMCKSKGVILDVCMLTCLFKTWNYLNIFQDPALMVCEYTWQRKLI